MRHNLLLGVSLSAALLSQGVQAQEFGPPIRSTVVLTNQEYRLAGETPATKEVVFMNLKLTEQQKQMLQNYKPTFTSHLKYSPLDLPSMTSVDLKGTPVLDQGKHGACVTFAVAGAIDSLLGKGDFVSPLCSLMLGKYLEERSYYPSGWDGASGPAILNQMLQYGIVSRTLERTHGCGGVNAYPLDDEEIPKSSFNDISEYKNISMNLNETPHFLLWEPLYRLTQRFSVDPAKPYQPDVALNELKHALATRLDDIDTRVNLGVIIPMTKKCSGSACATRKKQFDTWAVTKEVKEVMRQSKPEYGGHEMLVIGYDDNAIAVERDGTKHQGLLILRNSWGSDVGDNGNYYMTYDFFKQFLLDMQSLMYFKS